jgi:hypothetical protein
MSDDERPLRENMMQRRLRKARGEEVEEDLELYDPYEEDDRPRVLGDYPARRYEPRPLAPAGGGCAQHQIERGLVALLLGGLFLNQAIGGLGRLFQPPDVAEILATPTPEVISGASVVQRVRQLARLETSSYTVQTVIEVNQSQGNPIFDFFAGDALLLIAQGTVVAGVDLGALDEQSVTVAPDGSQITVRLPPAQIFAANLDNNGTRVYSRDRGWFAPDNVDLETLARQEAEAQILQAACEDGIMTKATEQAAVALQQFLGLAGDAEVVVLPAAPAPCALEGAAQVTPVPTP